MEVILLERIARLGGVGDVVKVKDGFGRNYLIPTQKALRASDANKALFESQREVLEKQNAERRDAAQIVVIADAAKNDVGAVYGLTRGCGMFWAAGSGKLCAPCY